MILCCYILLAEAYECDGQTASFVNREVVEVKCLLLVFVLTYGIQFWGAGNAQN